MVDTGVLKAQYDLRQVVEQDLGPAPMRGGRALLWRCPFHHERKGYSLAVWADGFRCFGKCQVSGDVFDWLQRYRGLSFQAALEVLGAMPRTALTRPVTRPMPPAEPPPGAWQAAACQMGGNGTGQRRIQFAFVLTQVRYIQRLFQLLAQPIAGGHLFQVGTSCFQTAAIHRGFQQDIQYHFRCAPVAFGFQRQMFFQGVQDCLTYIFGSQLVFKYHWVGLFRIGFVFRDLKPYLFQAVCLPRTFKIVIH